jgi:hypothetical protein
MVCQYCNDEGEIELDNNGPTAKRQRLTRAVSRSTRQA